MKTLSLIAGTLVLIVSATLFLSASTDITLPADEASAAARLASTPRHAEWVTINGAGNDKITAWVVYPERKDKAPVVLVVHEIFGLSEWARAVADQYAAEGFIAVAPDFLSGKGPNGGNSSNMTVDAARALNSQLDQVEVQARLNATAQWATSLPSATKSYGIVGYCWGGAVSYAYATVQPGLGAAVGFYGTAPTPAAIANVKAPILALYGGSDARVTSTLEGFQAEMKRLGKRFESEVYDGAGHGFLRQQGGQNGANLAATQKAWPRSVAFLKAALEKK